LSFTEEIVELVMMYRSISRPASGRFALNQWTQLTLTRRVLIFQCYKQFKFLARCDAGCYRR
jgi:hypothetical protein